MILLEAPWLGLATAATGITSILGLLGFIYFVVLRVSHQHTKLKFTPELISALKKSDINVSDLKGLDVKVAQKIIERDSSLSSEILKTGVSKELNDKAKFTLIISLALLLSAMYLAYLEFVKKSYPATYSYSGVTLDDTSNDKIEGVEIEIKNHPTKISIQSDVNGQFHFDSKIPEITLMFSHAKYKQVTLHRNLNSFSEDKTDTIALKKNEEFTIVKLTGYVIDERQIRLRNVVISSPNANQHTRSDSLGFFTIELLYPVNSQGIIFADLKGYKPWKAYVDNSNSNIPILLTKQ